MKALAPAWLAALSVAALAACSGSDRAAPPTPFENAIEAGDLDYIDSYVAARGARPSAAADLQNGLDVNARHCPDNEPETSIEIYRKLLGAGADVNALVQDDLGDRTTTPLTRAAFYCEPEVVAFLIDSGASVNAAGDDGMTPLMSAADAYYGDIAGKVDLLLAEGASRGAVDAQERTALDYALENERVRTYPTVLTTLAGRAGPGAPVAAAPSSGS
jgi:ankyrin repeat protein